MGAWGDRRAALGAMGIKQGLENVVAAARMCDVKELKLRFVLLGSGSQRID